MPSRRTHHHYYERNKMNSNKQQYVVVSGASIDLFKKDCNLALGDDCEPLGGLVYTGLVYMQAFIKKHEEPVKVVKKRGGVCRPSLKKVVKNVKDS